MPKCMEAMHPFTSTTTSAILTRVVLTIYNHRSRFCLRGIVKIGARAFRNVNSSPSTLQARVLGVVGFIKQGAKVRQKLHAAIWSATAHTRNSSMCTTSMWSTTPPAILTPAVPIGLKIMSLKDCLRKNAEIGARALGNVNSSPTTEQPRVPGSVSFINQVAVIRHSLHVTLQNASTHTGNSRICTTAPCPPV